MDSYLDDMYMYNRNNFSRYVQRPPPRVYYTRPLFARRSNLPFRNPIRNSYGSGIRPTGRWIPSGRPISTKRIRNRRNRMRNKKKSEQGQVKGQVTSMPLTISTSKSFGMTNGNDGWTRVSVRLADYLSYLSMAVVPWNPVYLSDLLGRIGCNYTGYRLRNVSTSWNPTCGTTCTGLIFYTHNTNTVGFSQDINLLTNDVSGFSSPTWKPVSYTVATDPNKVYPVCPTATVDLPGESLFAYIEQGNPPIDSVGYVTVEYDVKFETLAKNPQIAPGMIWMELNFANGVNTMVQGATGPLVGFLINCLNNAFFDVGELVQYSGVTALGQQIPASPLNVNGQPVDVRTVTANIVGIMLQKL